MSGYGMVAIYTALCKVGGFILAELVHANFSAHCSAGVSEQVCRAS